jgi:hypothetical protein
MVRPVIEMSAAPAISKPRSASAQSSVVAGDPSTEEIDTALEPSVEPHDEEPCVPGSTSTDRVDADVVAARADTMESQGVAHEPHDEVLEAEFEFDTMSAARASRMGTDVGAVESLDSLAVAALMRYTIVVGLETPVNVCDVAVAATVTRVGDAHVARLLASHASMAYATTLEEVLEVQPTMTSSVPVRRE